MNYNDMLLQILLDIKRSNTSSGRCGLCFSIDTLSITLYNARECRGIRELSDVTMMSWPEHSGDELHPVATLGNAEAQYLSVQANNAMWSGEYGVKRIELLDYMLTTLGRT